ncbi:hypothetical protein LTS18_013543 [Coniosporium uncinatum]|uniref:Uncharacterized protein n=1 Tax=Coniosporium uncinatum TaxID=93489 RepID=A0ACC3DYG6_9PEZI|nr:hypothetical protein LTS18_013543 [Coniosporium uncinatum]
MKTDNYLTLCLEQAALSPLHYRHGCVIVRGGKVIGQGYNDYRSGFDGGALKSGRLSSTALDGPAIAKLKRKHKRKSKDSHELVGSERTKPFVPFEGTGGGHHINTPLSMHSEMMAIHSALSHSSTLASTMASYQKPCFKISGSSKRKERLRRDALKAYVERVCETAAYTGVKNENENDNKKNAEEEGSKGKDEDVAAPTWKGAEKRRMNQKNHHHHEKKNQSVQQQQRKQYVQHVQQQKHSSLYHHHQYAGQYDRSGQHAAQQPQHGSSKPPTSKTPKTDRSNSRPSIALPAECYSGTDGRLTPSSASSKTRKKFAPDKQNPATTQALLLPNGQTSSSSKSVKERTKNPRLNGADLYVARLGWRGTGTGPTPKSKATRVKHLSSSPVRPSCPCDGAEPVVGYVEAGEDETSLSSSISSLASTSITPSPSASTSTSTSMPTSPSPPPSRTTPSTGSLHDELTTPSRNPSPSTPTPKQQERTPTTFDKSIIHASRPCYRCTTYMHNVGIKRVFWSTEGGEWQGAKVRDLVDALDCSGHDGGDGDGDGGGTARGVFVTKHEVLMLRRMMGQQG